MCLDLIYILDQNDQMDCEKRLLLNSIQILKYFMKLSNWLPKKIHTSIVEFILVFNKCWFKSNIGVHLIDVCTK